MANDQTAEEMLTSLVEYVGMQMLRVEELSLRSWRYVLVATPTEDGNFGPEMRASYSRPTECLTICARSPRCWKMSPKG